MTWRSLVFFTQTPGGADGAGSQNGVGSRASGRCRNENSDYGQLSRFGSDGGGNKE